MYKNIIGIDISKKSFHACENSKVNIYENNSKGNLTFIKKLPSSSYCVMESTSTYGYNLAKDLIDNGHHVYIVNPVKIKYFIKMGLSKAKTDNIDAKQITKFAEMSIDTLTEYKFASDEIQECKQIITSLIQLKKQHTALLNQLEALIQQPQQNKLLIKSIQKIIKYLEYHIKLLEAEASKLIKKDNPQMVENICSIKGIGESTAILLISKTSGFESFENSKQLSSFFGCCPRIIESGTSVKGRSNISKIGHADVRTRLYMCALTASKHNRTCRDLYQRLLMSGKAKKVALLAVVNKLIKQIFAVAKNNVLFDDNFQNKLVF